MSNLYQYKKKRAIPKVKNVNSEDKHVAMLQAIAPFARKASPRNVTEVEIAPATKNLKVLFLLMPEWSASFPPFNIARLSAVSRRAGYETKAIDLNVESFQYINVENEGKLLPFDPWNGARDWHWLNENYYQDLHPILEPVFTRYIDEIIEYKPDLIAFTMYYCNAMPSMWMAEKLKDLLPDATIAAGGPYLQTDAYRIKGTKYKDTDKQLFNYGVIGEGEILFLKILSEIEAGMKFDETQIYTQPENQRIDLNNLPLPDYRHFDFNKYEFPNGILTEFSRGCVAKCTFCEETHFWKYRQRGAVDAITEIENLYYEKGTDVVWFIDSLVNGNLKELRAFCKAIIAKELDIHWTGYCRCDGRMDREFYEDLADSGCTFLNYGVESGSQRVLDDMDKRVKVHEMEQNFKDGKEVGIGAMTNWIVAFPTEDYQDFADTLTFIWRNRNNGIIIIATASGYGLGARTVTGQNPSKFNLADVYYLNNWISKNLDKGKPHTLNRVKEFVIFLQQIEFGDTCHIPHRPNLPIKHYELFWDNPNLLKEIEYENFNYRIIKTGISPWADNLVNEPFVLFRMLWRTRGGFGMKLKYDIEDDLEEFGANSAGEYSADIDFRIHDNGEWTFSIECEFNPEKYDPDNPNRAYPFCGFDHTQFTENAAIRARKLARPKHGNGPLPKDEEQKIYDYAYRLNRSLDLSFKFKWSGYGTWTDDKSTTVRV